MRSSRLGLRVALACICLITILAGCMPTGLNATHDYVLVHTVDGGLVRVADDAPLYQQFDQEVRANPKAALLLNVFEHTNEAYLATNTRTHFSQTVANRPVIVIDAGEGAVLRDIRVQDGDRRVPIELVLGLGNAGTVDMAYTREALPRAVAPLVMELVGLEPPDAAAPAPARDALWSGFAAALERIQVASGEGGVPVTTCPENAASPQEDAARIGAFFCRLLATTSANYPQSYLLWFASYDAGEAAYGKVLLAMRRMPPDAEASIDAFITTYGETFPAERETIHALATEVLGAAPQA